MNHTLHVPENPKIDVDVTVRHEIVPPINVEEAKSLMWTGTLCVIVLRIFARK